MPISTMLNAKSCSKHLHQAAEVIEVVDELKQLTDVIGDGGAVWIHLTKILLINLAQSYEMHEYVTH